MRVIGFCGPAGSGKDTVAGMVTTYLFRKKVIRQGFADKLKLSAARCFDPEVTQEQAIDWCNTLKTTGEVTAYDDESQTAHTVTGRAFLQHYGTEAHRDVFGSDFWLDAVLPVTPSAYPVDGEPKVISTRDDCDVLLIPDVRFLNEAERVLQCDGELWRVDRPEVTPIASSGHASEGGVPDDLVTVVVNNHGTKAALRALVHEILHDRDLLV